MAKRYKPSAAAICAASTGLNPMAGRGAVRAFTLADLRKMSGAFGDRKDLPARVAWLKRYGIIQGPDRGPYALTPKGVKVVARACTVMTRGRRRR